MKFAVNFDFLHIFNISSTNTCLVWGQTQMNLQPLNSRLFDKKNLLVPNIHDISRTFTFSASQILMAILAPFDRFKRLGVPVCCGTMKPLERPTVAIKRSKNIPLIPAVDSGAMV